MEVEEMVVEIQKGNKKYIPLTWEKVYKLIYAISDRIFAVKKVSCIKSGYDKDDLHQVAYYGFLMAIKQFDTEKGFKFTAYLNYCVLNAINRYTEIYKKRNQPLNESVSIDAYIKDTENSETTLCEIIPDPASKQAFDAVTVSEEKVIVHNAVNLLSEKEREVIKERYFENRTLMSISRRLCCSRERVRQIEKDAIKHLRQSPILFLLYRENYLNSRLRSVTRFYTDPQLFGLYLRFEKKLRNLGRSKYYVIVDELVNYNKEIQRKEVKKITDFFFDVIDSN